MIRTYENLWIGLGEATLAGGLSSVPEGPTSPSKREIRDYPANCRCGTFGE